MGHQTLMLQWQNLAGPGAGNLARLYGWDTLDTIVRKLESDTSEIISYGGNLWNFVEYWVHWGLTVMAYVRNNLRSVPSYKISYTIPYEFVWNFIRNFLRSVTFKLRYNSLLWQSGRTAWNFNKQDRRDLWPMPLNAAMSSCWKALINMTLTI